MYRHTAIVLWKLASVNHALTVTTTPSTNYIIQVHNTLMHCTLSQSVFL